MVRISPQIMMELTTADTRMIAKAIIGENIGGGPGTHATVIHAAEEMGGGMGPVWHYLDNEATKHPEPRYLVAMRIGEEGLRYKVNKGATGMWAMVENNSPLIQKIRTINSQRAGPVIDQSRTTDLPIPSAEDVQRREAGRPNRRISMWQAPPQLQKLRHPLTCGQ